MSQQSLAPRWRSSYFPNRCGTDRGPRAWPSVGTASNSSGHWKSSITEAQQAWMPGRSIRETKPQRLLPLLRKKCSSTVAPQTTGQMCNMDISGQSMNSPWCQPILSWPLLILRGPDPHVLTVNISLGLVSLERTFKSWTWPGPILFLPLFISLLLKSSFYLHCGGYPPFGSHVCSPLATRARMEEKLPSFGSQRLLGSELSWRRRREEKVTCQPLACWAHCSHLCPCLDTSVCGGGGTGSSCLS